MLFIPTPNTIHHMLTAGTYGRALKALEKALLQIPLQ